MKYTMFLPSVGEVRLNANSIEISDEKYERIKCVHMMIDGRVPSTKKRIAIHFDILQPAEDRPGECGYIHVLFYKYNGTFYEYNKFRSIH